MLRELHPYYDRAKSFYGKAMVLHRDNVLTLYSYDTPVCEIRPKVGFIRLWNGWSVTTARHINEFRRQCAMTAICKSDWLALPVED